jgi:hypothetical protein
MGAGLFAASLLAKARNTNMHDRWYTLTSILGLEVPWQKCLPW